jgi:hypothetical protein
MHYCVKNVSQHQGASIAHQLQNMIDRKLITQEELVAIQLEYEDEHLEDWKIHLNQSCHHEPTH